MENLCFEERTVFALRELYKKYGYRQYRMGKFEEYDLYLKNKNFLVSDNIITFTDTDGRLLALKPDVTLSIIKNMNYDLCPIQKVYYNENVYRVAKGTNSFKEIMQSGLECIGNIDDYTIYETLLLAAKSLEAISKEYVMDVSHIGIVSEVLDSVCISDSTKNEVIKAIEQKNLSQLSALEKREGADFSLLKQLITTYGTLDEVLPFLKNISSSYAKDLINIVTALENAGLKNKIRIDFSITGDTNYYSGVVFKGFINGIPTSVLSGGQYDNLMSKFGRSERAIGFAIYLDMLERLDEDRNEFDVDTVLIYDETVSIDEVGTATKKLADSGNTVLALTEIPKGIRYKKLVNLTGRGVGVDA